MKPTVLAQRIESIGKVVPAGGAVSNILVEPPFTILSHGAGQPALQVLVGFDTQFVMK